MPIHEVSCRTCGNVGEVIRLKSSDGLACPSCGSSDVERVLSATSGLTGRTSRSMPGPGDTACCGSAPGGGDCAGPGSCCGKNQG